MGTEKVDGKDAYKLKLVKDGKDAFYFVDATTGLLLKVVTKAMAQGAEIEVQNVYTDYKKNEDGYMFPYTSTNEQGVITFDKISTNVPVDDKIFTN